MVCLIACVVPEAFDATKSARFLAAAMTGLLYFTGFAGSGSGGLPSRRVKEGWESSTVTSTGRTAVGYMHD